MTKVSEYLAEARLRKKVSLDEAAEATKIKKTYLKALEEGRFNSLPSRSYVVGFIKTYAQYLGLSQETVFAFLRREYGEEKLEVIPKYRKKQPQDRQPFYRQPKIILGVVAAIAIIGYMIYQFIPLFFGPKLSISSPTNEEVITNNVVTVNGKTDPFAIVSVDGEIVDVDITGAFQKSLYVFSGNKIVSIVAKNKFGKETIDNIPVKVE